MTKATKEQVYDAEISPLMAKVIEICKREKIAVLANFQLSVEGEEDLRCTTALLDRESKPSQEQLSALSLLRDGYAAFVITTRQSSDSKGSKA